MLLASVTAIREFLGFDNMVDITAAITGALHTAEAELVASLRTEFGTTAVVDTFWCVHRCASNELFFLPDGLHLLLL